MVADEKLCQVRREVGRMGGNPRLLNQNLATRDKQNSTPSSSTSSSNIDNKEAALILTYLNEKTSRNYQAVKANTSLISARIKEGFTPNQCKAVIDSKVVAWSADEKMIGYLRPKTLFNATNFAQYVGELSSLTVSGGETWE